MTITIRNPEAPATEGQIKFLRSLMTGRETGIDANDVDAVLTAWEAGGILTKIFASGKIEEFKALPYRARKQPEPGYYIHPDDGEMYVVVKTKDGQRTYAKRLVNTGTEAHAHWSWEYDRGAGRLLADMKPLTVEEAAKFGHLHGRCFKCLRLLTDPESVQRGMGPVCAKALR